MRKIVSILCAVSFLLLLVGCQVQTKETLLLKQGVVESIRVRTLDENHEYFFKGTNTKSIAKYLENLTLQSDFEEDPNKYDGGTWVIIIAYENGDEVTLFHFGNKFICSEDGPWYKMTYEEASQFETLLVYYDAEVVR